MRTMFEQVTRHFFIALIFFILAGAEVHGQSSTIILDNVQYHSSGHVTVNLGNEYYHSSGVSVAVWRNTYVFSNGKTSEKIGNYIFDSDGSYRERIDDCWLDSDGALTEKIGDAYFHSDEKLYFITGEGDVLDINGPGTDALNDDEFDLDEYECDFQSPQE